MWGRRKVEKSLREAEQALGPDHKVRKAAEAARADSKNWKAAPPEMDFMTAILSGYSK
jgi:hypothetical protein